jgi:ATP-dependent RNA helicase DHX8/PRP22
MRTFDSATGAEVLKTCATSQAQARQRAGRAGRERAGGQCYRLYPERVWFTLERDTQPEIERVDLAQVVLQLKSLGVSASTFEYLSPPPARALEWALETLDALGALAPRTAGARAVDDAALTEHGAAMAQLPLSPVFAHTLLRSSEPAFSCAREMLSVVALLSSGEHSVLITPPLASEARARAAEAHRPFTAHEGDLATLLRVHEAYSAIEAARGGADSPTVREWCADNFVSMRAMRRAALVRRQLESILARLRPDALASPGEAREPAKARDAFLRALTAGLFLNAAVRAPTASAGAVTGARDRDRAHRASGGYETLVGKRRIAVHPQSSLFARNPPAKCILFCEAVHTTRLYARYVTAIEESWLPELAPRFFQEEAASEGSRAPEAPPSKRRRPAQAPYVYVS